MTRRAGIGKGSALPALLALAALVALVSAPRAQAATAPCGATFSVLHNDRIGSLKLPAGQYDITLIEPQRITCARASHLFARFLQDFNGVLPGAWTLNVAKARFINANGFGFAVAPASGGGGGGGSQHPPGTTTKCPTFQVLNDDLIDGQRFPAGTYAMTAIGGLACSKASNLFRGSSPTTRTISPASGAWILAPAPSCATAAARAFRSTSGASEGSDPYFAGSAEPRWLACAVAARTGAGGVMRRRPS